MAVEFFQQNGKGQYYFSIDLTTIGLSGIQDGTNLTIQVISEGGDGNLYQVRITSLFTTALVALHFM